MNETSASIKQRKELTPRELWDSEITYAEKDRERFVERAKLTVDRYVDERDAASSGMKKFNIFWANTNIMESALYAQIPKASVSRKYPDYKDQVARVAALIMERMLQQDLNDPQDTFDGVMKMAVQDRLIPGVATAWLRLETDTEEIPETEGGQVTNDNDSLVPGPKGGENGFLVPATEQEPSPQDPQPVGEGLPLLKIKDQRVAVDYVHWNDFLWSPCRVWAERRWVSRIAYMTYDQVSKRFGEAKAKLTSFNARSGKSTETNLLETENDIMMRARVYEIWDREKRKVIWFCKDCSEILDERDDFLGLSTFEPCPMPMFANVTNDRLMPRPDYYMVQDQYQELDQINQRISKLNEAIKVVGVYNKAEGMNLSNMLSGPDNQLVPVDNWAMFSEKGGVEGAISWLPLDQVVAAQERLMRARDEIKAQIYELTGISDIVRGASKASETLGAQEIKAQFASVRIKKLQDEVAKFAADILRIKAEIQVKHFDPALLINKSGISKTDNDIYVASAVAMLKSEQGFQWRIKIQAGSMAQADYAMEKKDAIEFMSASTGYLAQALPMANQVPEMKPVILGLLKWGVAKFHSASDIEGLIDKQIDELIGKPPAPPPKDPKIQALEMKGQQDAQKMQMEQQKSQQDMANEQQRMQMEERQRQEEMAFAQQMQQMDMAMKKFELMMKQQELYMKKQEMDMNIRFKGQEQEQNLQLTAAKGAQELELNETRGQQQLEQQEVAHEQSLEQKAAAAKVAQKTTE